MTPGGWILTGTSILVFSVNGNSSGDITSYTLRLLHNGLEDKL